MQAQRKMIVHYLSLILSFCHWFKLPFEIHSLRNIHTCWFLHIHAIGANRVSSMISAYQLIRACARLKYRPAYRLYWVHVEVFFRTPVVEPPWENTGPGRLCAEKQGEHEPWLISRWWALFLDESSYHLLPQVRTIYLLRLTSRRLLSKSRYIYVYT